MYGIREPMDSEYVQGMLSREFHVGVDYDFWWDVFSWGRVGVCWLVFMGSTSVVYYRVSMSIIWVFVGSYYMNHILGFIGPLIMPRLEPVGETVQPSGKRKRKTKPSALHGNVPSVEPIPIINKRKHLRRLAVIANEAWVLPDVPNCSLCGARSFYREPKVFCCRNGQIHVALPKYPDNLLD